MAQPVPPPMAAPIGTDNPNVNKAPQRLSTNKMAARLPWLYWQCHVFPFWMFLTVFVLLVLPKIQPKIAEGENMRELQAGFYRHPTSTGGSTQKCAELQVRHQGSPEPFLWLRHLPSQSHHQKLPVLQHLWLHLQQWPESDRSAAGGKQPLGDQTVDLTSKSSKSQQIWRPKLLSFRTLRGNTFDIECEKLPKTHSLALFLRATGR